MKYYEEFLKLGCFSFENAQKIVGTKESTEALLNKYIKNEYIARVRRGLYVALDLVNKDPVANKFVIASSVADGAVVSHHSAFEYYGYSNQVSYDVCVSSANRFRPFEFAGFHYHRMIPGINSGVVQNAGGITVTDIERTVLDSTNDFENDMGFEELMNCIFNIPVLDEKKLLLYLGEYNRQFLYQKTGFIFEHLKEELSISDDFLARCKEGAHSSSRYLIKDTPKELACFSKEWNLTIPKNLWRNVTGGDEYAAI